MTTAASVCGNNAGHRWIFLQPPHVVDENGTELHRSRRHAGLVSIDRDRNVERAVKRCKDRLDASEFFLDRERCRARTRKFATDINDVSALGR